MITRKHRKAAAATVADVAREAGVSASAVSLVLRKRPGVSMETREKVRVAADKLKFQYVARPKTPKVEAPEYFHVPTGEDIQRAKMFCGRWIRKGVEAEEAYGEAMIALMEAAVNYDPASFFSFEKHLYQKVRSRLGLKFGSAMAKRVKSGLVFFSGDAPGMGSEGEAFSAWDYIPDVKEIIRSHQSEQVRELLEFVDHEESNVLERRFLDGETLREISLVMGFTADQVEMLIKTGIATIRRKLGLDFQVT